MNLPTTFCISLKETPIRTNGFLDLAKKADLPVSVFYGVLGDSLGLIPKLTNELECPKKNVFINERAIGCNLSHFLLWNMLKYRSEEEFLIFEDDAIIPDDFISSFKKLYDQLPSNWEFVYIGWIPYGKDSAPLIVSDGISIRSPSATHAYMIKKSAIEILCDNVVPFQSPLDLAIINRCLPKLKHYVFDPPLVRQRSYANVKDPVWMSLIYDWSSDLYGFKRKILREMNLGDGWYNLEKSTDAYWIWSRDTFTIKLPECAENIHLVFSSPIRNTLSLFCDGKQTDFEFPVGDNEIQLHTGGAVLLSGKVYEQFIPMRYDPACKDERDLGICLKAIKIDVGSIPVTVGVEEL